MQTLTGGEFAFIEWLRRQTPSHPAVLLGPGDDAAVLHPTTRPLLATTDMLMDGTDFVLAEVGGRAAGRKAMAANLSDIAAMAGQPLAALVALALPRRCPVAGRTTRQLAEDLYGGVRDLADAFDVALVGGDTNSWDGPLAIAITVLGVATERGYVPRSGARPGDWIFVTGPLGGSILGHHLDFSPRVREALLLHAAADLHAMCDIRACLVLDLSHILDASGCGAVLHAAAIPLTDAAHAASRRSGRSPLDHALYDGEDFELLFTVAPADGERLLQNPPLPGLCRIGECIPQGLYLEQDGRRLPLVPRGWEHQFD